MLGDGGRLLVLAGAAISMFGYVSGDMLGSPRALFAFARDGMLPAAMARIHPRFHTPYIAIAVYAVHGRDHRREQQLHAAGDPRERRRADALSDVRRRVGTSCSAAMSAPTACRSRSRADPVIPLLAAGVIVWMLSHATRREFAVEGIVLTVAALFYLVRKRGALGPVQREPSVTA